MATTVTLDPARLAVIAECSNTWDCGDGIADWPNNIISQHAVVYNDGTIARRGDTVTHQFDPVEVALCVRVSQAAEQVMRGVEIGMGSEATSYYVPFFIAARDASAKPRKIDEDLIRAYFGDTIFPLATIAVEPFAEDTTWWQAVWTDGEACGQEYFTPWKALCDWFTQQSAFVDAAFVSIGEWEHFNALPDESYPPGTELTPSSFPRLPLGLTENGSLVGLFGYTVQT